MTKRRGVPEAPIIYYLRAFRRTSEESNTVWGITNKSLPSVDWSSRLLWGFVSFDVVSTGIKNSLDSDNRTVYSWDTPFCSTIKLNWEVVLIERIQDISYFKECQGGT